MKIRLLVALSRFARNWPFSAGLIEAAPDDGTETHGPTGDVRRARKTPRTEIAEVTEALKYTRATVVFLAPAALREPCFESID